LIDRRQDAESHRTLSLLCLAQSGDGAAIKKQMDQWEKEAE
jgi:hypothetical protein